MNRNVSALVPASRVASTSDEVLISVPLYGLGFSHAPQHPFRAALTTLVPGPLNKLIVVDQNPNRPQELQQIANVTLGFPATKVGWEPTQSVLGNAYNDGDAQAELLATTGDVLRIWDLSANWDDGGGRGYVGRNNGFVSHELNARSVLTNVSGLILAARILTRRANLHRVVFRLSRRSRGTPRVQSQSSLAQSIQRRLFGTSTARRR